MTPRYMAKCSRPFFSVSSAGTRSKRESSGPLVTTVKLLKKAEFTLCGFRHRVAINVYAFEDFAGFVQFIWRTRRDDADLVTGFGKRKRFHPHAPVERHGKIFDEN